MLSDNVKLEKEIERNLNREILGRGKKLTLNSFFSNNTVELFRRNHRTLSDEELPLVTNFSGLSRNQRKKYKNWAFDPNLTRLRMDAAQKLLMEQMDNIELADKTSMMSEILESLAASQIPESQTHFKIPDLPVKSGSLTNDAAIPADNVEDKSSKGGEEISKSLNSRSDIKSGSKMGGGTKVGKDDFSWAELADEDSDEAIVENLALYDAEKDNLDERTSVLVEKSVKESSGQSKNTGMEEYIKEKYSTQKPSKGHRVGASRGPTNKWSNKLKAKSLSPRPSVNRPSPVFEDHRVAKQVIQEMFHEFNINLLREFSDDLMFQFNMHGYLSEDMIFMYIRGILKERQVSMTKRQESISNKMAETSAALGKQLEQLKSNIAIVQQMGDLAIEKKVGKRSEVVNERGRSVGKSFHSINKSETSQPTSEIRYSKVMSPVPAFEAPKYKGYSENKKWVPIGIEEKQTETISKTSDEPLLAEGKTSKKGKEPMSVEDQERLRREEKDRKKGIIAQTGEKKLMSASIAAEKQHKLASEEKQERVLQEKKDEAALKRLVEDDEEILFHGMDDAQLIVKAMMHLSAPPDLKNPDMMIKLMDALGRDIWVEILMTKDPILKRNYIMELAKISFDLME
ncbi:TPA_asm: P [Zanthoxylum betacytorhabdovirus 1]|nr:TPA_asm: P [Zanthoxilum betacytorhabdovirus 1]